MNLVVIFLNYKASAAQWRFLCFVSSQQCVKVALKAVRYWTQPEKGDVFTEHSGPKVVVKAGEVGR